MLCAFINMHGWTIFVSNHLDPPPKVLDPPLCLFVQDRDVKKYTKVNISSNFGNHIIRYLTMQSLRLDYGYCCAIRH